jgi:Transposase, Mutator family
MASRGPPLARTGKFTAWDSDGQRVATSRASDAKPVPTPHATITGAITTSHPRALRARGLSMSDIEAHLAEIDGVQVGRDLISRVTDAVMDDVREWQRRPLDDVYRRRRRGRAGRARDVVPEERGRTKFWMQVLSELRQRGVSDILLCCVDGLKDFPEGSRRSTRTPSCRRAWST